jgi:hypothetical protein
MDLAIPPLTLCLPCSQLGLPVRVVRKNPDPTAPYGCVLIFDGLYDVVG